MITLKQHGARGWLSQQLQRMMILHIIFSHAVMFGTISLLFIYCFASFLCENEMKLNQQWPTATFQKNVIINRDFVRLGRWTYWFVCFEGNVSQLHKHKYNIQIVINMIASLFHPVSIFSLVLLEWTFYRMMKLCIFHGRKALLHPTLLSGVVRNMVRCTSWPHSEQWYPAHCLTMNHFWVWNQIWE